MYKSLLFTAVALFDGVAAQNMTVDGIEYSRSDYGYSIHVTKDFTETSLTWKTFYDGAPGWFDFAFDNLFQLRVANCEDLEEIDFSDAPTGQTIGLADGGGGLEIFALPNVTTLKLGGLTKLTHLYLADFGSSEYYGDYALKFEAPHLQTVTRSIQIKALRIEFLTFDVLKVIGYEDGGAYYVSLNIQPDTEIYAISLPEIERVHSISISDALSVHSIRGLFKSSTTFFSPYDFANSDWATEHYGGSIII